MRESDYPCPHCKRFPTLESTHLDGRCPKCGEVFEYEEEDEEGNTLYRVLEIFATFFWKQQKLFATRA